MPRLDDARPIPSTSPFTQWFSQFECETLAHAAALAVEISHDPDAYTQWQTQLIVDDEPFGTFLLARARARFAGEDPVPYFSSAEVTSARRQEIVALADQASVDDFRTAVIALTPPERVAWLEWYQTASQQGQDAPEVLRKASHRVVEIVSEPSDSHPDLAPEIPAALAIEIGEVLDPDRLETLARALLQNAATWSSTHLSAVPGKMALGLTVSAHQPDSSQWFTALASHHELQRATPADAYAAVFAGWGHSPVIWALRGEEITPVTEKRGDQHAGFAQFIQMTEAQPTVSLPLHLVVLRHDDLSSHRRDDP